MTDTNSDFPNTPTSPSGAPAGYITPSGAASPETPQSSAQIEALRGNIWELVLSKVVEALTGFFTFGLGGAFDQLRSWAESIPIIGDLLKIIKQQTGIDLLHIFDGIDISNPGAILGAIVGVVQKFFDAVFNGITGGIAQAVSLAEIPLAFLGQIASIPAHIVEFVFGAIANLQAQVTAIQNNPTGANQTDDFSIVGVSAWTAITGSLAVSNLGPYIQSSGRVAAYIGTPSTPRKPSTDKHGIQITIDAKMLGSCRAWICGDTTMSNYAAVEIYSGFDGDSIRLLTGSSPSLVVVRKKQDFVAQRLQGQNTFDIWYEPSANTFHVLRNGKSVFDWVDTTNVVSHGSSKRNVGIVSNGLDRSDTGQWGPGIRKVTFYDR